MDKDIDFTKYDKNYSDANFLTYADNLFIQVMIAISTKEVEKIDHFVSDDVYNNIKDKVSALKDKNYTQRYDELNVKSTTITDKYVDGDYLVIKVTLISRSLDYILDNNNQIVSGNKDYRNEVINYLEFKKLKSVVDDKIVKKCPNCGNSMELNANGRCEFCHQIVDMENYDFILTDWSL